MTRNSLLHLFDVYTEEYLRGDVFSDTTGEYPEITGPDCEDFNEFYERVIANHAYMNKQDVYDLFTGEIKSIPTGRRRLNEEDTSTRKGVLFTSTEEEDERIKRAAEKMGISKNLFLRTAAMTLVDEVSGEGFNYYRDIVNNWRK